MTRIKFILSLVFIAVLTKLSYAQTVEGTIAETNTSNPLSGIIISATSEENLDRTENTITDINGNYFLANLMTATNEFDVVHEEIKIQNNNGSLIISITSKDEIKKISIHDLSERLITENEVTKDWFANTYSANLDISNLATQAIIISDGVHKGTKYIANIQGNATVQELESKFKNSTGDTAPFRFLVRDSQDEYATLDTIIDLNKTSPNNIDFYLNKWPEFFTNLYLNFKDKFGNKLTNTAIEVDETNGLYSFDLETDSEGNVEVVDVSIPATTEDRLIPDSLDFEVSITGDSYLEDFNHVLEKVSDGNFFKNYTNLTPEQQEFFANLYATVTHQTTGDAITSAQSSLRTIGGTPTIQTTNINGEVGFESVSIEALNEITSGETKFVFELSKAGLETMIDTFNMTNIDYNKSYEMVDAEVQPDLKQYTLVLHSKDGEGNDLTSTNWEVYDAATLIGSGNTGSNSLDTLEFLNTNPNLDITIKTNKTEYSNYQTTTNIPAEQTVLKTTVNEILKYLYELEVRANDSQTGLAVDSLDVKAYLNGQLLMQDATLENTIAELETTQAGHTLDLKLLVNGTGYIRSDSIPITINEGQANQLIASLVQEEVIPEESVAYLWRAFMPEIAVPGTEADIKIESLDSDYVRIIQDIGSNGWWQDTIPVNSEGTTQYKITYTPTVPAGEIPLYVLEKILTLQAGEESTGTDDVKALEQQQSIQGFIENVNTKAKVANAILKLYNEDNTAIVQTTTTDANGFYRFDPTPTGTTGYLDIITAETNDFNFDNVPIGTTTSSEGGEVDLLEKVINFSDSIKTYNISQIDKFQMNHNTGELQELVKSELTGLDGSNSVFLPLTIDRDINVYFVPGTTEANKQFALTQIPELITNRFGIPWTFKEVYEPIPTTTNITSLNSTYLNGLADQGKIGINLEVTSLESGFTVNHESMVEGKYINGVSNVRILSPDIYYTEVVAFRELLHRMGVKSDDMNQYTPSIGNGSSPDVQLDQLNNKDYINYLTLFNLHQSQVKSNPKERIHSGTFYLVE